MTPTATTIMLPSRIVISRLRISMSAFNSARSAPISACKSALSASRSALVAGADIASAITSATLPRGRRRHCDRLDLGGAEFELRDLADRVELRVGQHVGRGFGIAERDEHLTQGDGTVGACLQFDHAAAGGDADLLAGGDAEAAQ